MGCGVWIPHLLETVLEPGEGLYLRHGVSVVTGPPLLETVLEPGEVLYLPHGISFVTGPPLLLTELGRGRVRYVPNALRCVTGHPIPHTHTVPLRPTNTCTAIVFGGSASLNKNDHRLDRRRPLSRESVQTLDN